LQALFDIVLVCSFDDQLVDGLANAAARRVIRQPESVRGTVPIGGIDPLVRTIEHTHQLDGVFFSILKFERGKLRFEADPSCFVGDVRYPVYFWKFAI